MKNKIAHFIPQYGTNTGTGQAIEQTSLYLDSLDKFDIYIYKEGKKNIKYRKGNITFIEYKSKFIPFFILKDFFLNKKKIQSLGIHQPFTFNNLIIALFSRIPLDYFPHGCFNPTTLSAPTKRFKKLVYLKSIEQFILRGSRRVICSTLKEEEDIKKIGIFQTDVAFFPFKIENFQYEMVDKLQFRNKYGFAKDDLIFLFVGRWDIYTKGLDILLEATKKANKLNPRIKTILVGYEKKKNELSSLINEVSCETSVFPIGALYGKEKNEALMSSDYYVQSSRFESFGMSIIEALYAGIPVLLSKGCSISKEVEQFNGCLTFNPDIEELTHLMVSASYKRNDLELIALNGKEWVNKILNSESLASDWIKIYN